MRWNESREQKQASIKQNSIHNPIQNLVRSPMHFPVHDQSQIEILFIINWKALFTTPWLLGGVIHHYPTLCVLSPESLTNPAQNRTCGGQLKHDNRNVALLWGKVFSYLDLKKNNANYFPSGNPRLKQYIISSRWEIHTYTIKYVYESLYNHYLYIYILWNRCQCHNSSSLQEKNNKNLPPIGGIGATLGQIPTGWSHPRSAPPFIGTSVVRFASPPFSCTKGTWHRNVWRKKCVFVFTFGK